MSIICDLRFGFRPELELSSVDLLYRDGVLDTFKGGGTDDDDSSLSGLNGVSIASSFAISSEAQSNLFSELGS